MLNLVLRVITNKYACGLALFWGVLLVSYHGWWAILGGVLLGWFAGDRR